MSTVGIPSWHKSSYSGSDGDNCIEVAVGPGIIHVRDSKDTGIRSLQVSPTAWTAFTAHAKNGHE